MDVRIEFSQVARDLGAEQLRLDQAVKTAPQRITIRLTGFPPPAAPPFCECLPLGAVLPAALASRKIGQFP